MHKLYSATLLIAATAAAGAQQVPPVRLMNAPDASSPHTFAGVLAFR